MPEIDDFHAFNSTSGSSGGGHSNSGGGLGCGWIVIIIVAVLLIYFIINGAGWDAIDCLLGLGLLAFLFFRWIST